MLCDLAPPRLSEFNQGVYRTVVPPDHHYLPRVLQIVPWDDVYELLAPCYSPDQGRPAESPLLMQELMACTATNVKRLVRLGCAPTAGLSCGA